MVKIKFAIPKGSLEKNTFELLEKAMYRVRGQERTYRPVVDDPEIELKILRPQEIPMFVAEGSQDLGITGIDWIRETDADVEVLMDLEYGRVKLVVALPENIGFNSLPELFEHYWRNGKIVRISTEYLNIVARHVKSYDVYKKWFKDEDPLVITPWWKKGTNRFVSIFLSFGATEAKPPEDADAIIDVVETGRTLEQNNLKPVEVILESSAVLIANKKSLNTPDKREKILDVMTMLRGVIDGGKKLHIFVNVKEENLEQLLGNLPALKKPTISPLSAKGWYSVNTIVDKQEFLKLLPILRKLAQGLVVHEPQLILPLEDIPR